VANGLLRAATGCVAILPLGSGDDFLKMPPPRIRDASRALRSTPGDRGGRDAPFRERYNTGRAHPRNVRRVPGFLIGLAAYLGALEITLLRCRRIRSGCNWMMSALRPNDGDDRGDERARLRREFRVCPEARADDGELDFLIADSGSAEIWARTQIMRGAHGGHPRLRMACARRGDQSEEPLLVEADGDRPGRAPAGDRGAAWGA
jgi:hypothetical protein